MKLTTLLQIAGLLHLGLMCAGASMPRAVQLHAHLTALPSFIRRLFYVYYAFLGLVLGGFGVLTFWFAGAIAAGEPLARGFCVFLAVFWTARLLVAAFIFDVRPYLTTWLYRLGYQATNVVFLYLTILYVWAAMMPGKEVLP
jgi:hypothetical protein